LLGGVAPVDRGSQPRWEDLIAVSSQHLVTPALAWCLRVDPTVPDEVRGYLDAVLHLNTRRNELLLDTLHRIVGVLNAANIEPVLLKGAARLTEGIYPSPGLRVTGDIDVLIPEDRADNAASALQDIGFAQGGPVLPRGHHHLPMLCDPVTGAGVELHTAPAHRRSQGIMPPDWFFKGTRRATFRGLCVYLPDASRSIGHTIVHDQLDHQGYRYKRLELRQLLDFAVMRARHESTIDWAELDRRFGSAGVGTVLATYLKYAEAFFGQPPPRLGHAPAPDAIAALRSAMEQGLGRWAHLTGTLADYVAARRNDPLGIVKLLRPQTWRRAIRLMTTETKPKW
jgi:hypothetical protein